MAKFQISNFNKYSDIGVVCKRYSDVGVLARDILIVNCGSGLQSFVKSSGSVKGGG